MLFWGAWAGIGLPSKVVFLKLRHNIRCVVVFVAIFVLQSCALRQPLTDSEVRSAEIHVVQFSPSKTYDACTQALLDGAYQIVYSNKEAGVITARTQYNISGWSISTDHIVTMVVTVSPIDKNSSRMRIVQLIDGRRVLNTPRYKQLLDHINQQLALVSGKMGES